MQPNEEFEEIAANVRVRFWICLNPEHKTVEWKGDVATCLDCGLTSEMTARRQKVIERLVRAKVAAEIERVLSDYQPVSTGVRNGLRRAADIARGEA